MFFIVEKSEEIASESTQNSTNIVWLLTIYKLETQKIVNLLNDTDNESSKFATRKWHVINDQNNTEYGEALSLKQKLLKQVFVISQMHIFL